MRIEGMRKEARVRNKKGGFLPDSFRAISSYLKTVSGNASSIASTVCSAGASVALSVSGGEDDREREQVQWAGFDKLELSTGGVRHVLLLTYKNGFQVWDIENADNVHELVSKRDGAVAFLRLQPQPITMVPDVECFQDSRPLLLVVTEDQTLIGGNIQGGFCIGCTNDAGSSPQTEGSYAVPKVIQFYSFRSHTYVHELKFRSAIYGVRCSSTIVVVALATQIYCYDAATLQNKFSVLTYPIPQSGQGPQEVNIGFGPMDVGTRWLAYAANHAATQNIGRASPKHLTSSPGVSLSTSPANGSSVAHYAKESSKQLAAGIMTIGDMGYKKLTKYYSELLPDDASSPRSVNSNWKYNSNGFAGHAYEQEYAGTVVVRDFTKKSIVAQFRAHTSPLSALCFDPTGTLLITASVHGHNLNVYRIIAHSTDSCLRTTGVDITTSNVHLYRLNRGVTNAVIQDISFNYDSHWIAVSSLKGTSHLFAISPFGGVVGSHTHGKGNSNGNMIYGLTPNFMLPWWSNSEPLKMNQQALPLLPPPISLSVVSRIKNGNGVWHNPVSSAAAIATGKMNSAAVAALFHDSSDCNLETHLENSHLKDQLWVFSSSGHLIRYALHIGEHEAISYSNNAGMGVHTCGPRHEQDFKVLVEPLQKWDVARKINWIEREEIVDNLSHESVYAETHPKSVENYADETAFAHSASTERFEKEGPTAEEKRHQYISNSEVQTHHRWPPVWAKSEICFHAMISKTTKEESSDVVHPGGEIDIENIPTRIVEARKTDLVPVFEPHHNFKSMQQERNPVANTHSVISAFQMNWKKDGCIEENMDSGHLQVSSSGSSCGSQGGIFEGHPEVMNGFHHSNQDFEEHVRAVPNLNPQGLEHNRTSSDIEEISRSLRKLNIPNRDPNAKCHSKTRNLVSIASPSMDIPLGGEDVVVNTQISEVLRVTGGSKNPIVNEIGMDKKLTPKQGHSMVIAGGHIANSSVSHEDFIYHAGNKDISTPVVSIKGIELERGITTPKKEQDEDGWEAGLFPFSEED